MKKYSNFDLKKVSWIKIGGQVNDFYEAETSEEFTQIISEYLKEGKGFEVIGWGANTLFSDSGLKADLVKPLTKKLETVDSTTELIKIVKEKPIAVNLRHTTFKDSKITSGFDTSDLEYTEDDKEDIFVEIDAGVNLPFLINKTIDMGATGLNFFAGIPGTLGGAIFNNIHGGKRLISEFVASVTCVDRDGNLKTLAYPEIDFEYNQSTFQNENLIIISAVLHLKQGDIERAKRSAVEWARRKASQPKNSLGSVFHNLEPEVQAKLGYQTGSAAYVIEHVLKLSGYRVGGVMIPEATPADQVQVNKNIFMNLGDGTANDYLAVMNKVWKEAKEQLGIELKAEIFFKGFDFEEVKHFK